MRRGSFTYRARSAAGSWMDTACSPHGISSISAIFCRTNLFRKVCAQEQRKTGEGEIGRCALAAVLLGCCATVYLRELVAHLEPRGCMSLVEKGEAPVHSRARTHD